MPDTRRGGAGRSGQGPPSADTLLFAPDIHYQIYGEQFNETDLSSYRVTEYGDSFFLLQVLHGLSGYFIRAVPSVNVTDVFVMVRDLLEFCLYPAGTDAHHVDAIGTKLSSKSP